MAEKMTPTESINLQALEITRLNKLVKQLRADKRKLTKSLKSMDGNILDWMDREQTERRAKAEARRDLEKSETEVENLGRHISELNAQVRFHEKERDSNLTFIRHGLQLLRPELLVDRNVPRQSEPQAFDEYDEYDAPINRLLLGILQRIDEGSYYGFCASESNDRKLR